MRRTAYFTGLLILAAVLSVSCSEIWRIDPPELLSGTVWMGTNDARGEKLYFCYGSSEVLPYFHEETGVDGTQENGHLEMYFTSPSDTVKYVGTYNYVQYPAVYVKEMYGYVYLNIQNMETGEFFDPSKATMKHSDSHFYLEMVLGGTVYAYPVAEYTGDMSVIDSLRK